MEIRRLPRPAYSAGGHRVGFSPIKHLRRDVPIAEISKFLGSRGLARVWKPYNWFWLFRQSRGGPPANAQPRLRSSILAPNQRPPTYLQLTYTRWVIGHGVGLGLGLLCGSDRGINKQPDRNWRNWPPPKPPTAAGFSG